MNIHRLSLLVTQFWELQNRVTKGKCVTKGVSERCSDDPSGKELNINFIKFFLTENMTTCSAKNLIPFEIYSKFSSSEIILDTKCVTKGVSKLCH